MYRLLRMSALSSWPRSWAMVENRWAPAPIPPIQKYTGICHVQWACFIGGMP
jgi:hypothetical protein